MKTLCASALACVVLAVQAAYADPMRYELDPEHTSVAFLVKHVGYAATLGQFTEVSGSFTYDMETQTLSAVDVTVSTASLETFNAERDKHVRSGDFLNTEDFPEMRFTAEGGTPEGNESGTVSGDLALLGETHPLTLDVTLNKAAEYPFGHGRFVLGLSLRGTVARSDFGMTYGVENGLVGDDVQLIIETEAMRM